MNPATCTKCGAASRSGAMFCAVCGAELPTTAASPTGTVIAPIPNLDGPLLGTSPAKIESPPAVITTPVVPVIVPSTEATMPPAAATEVPPLPTKDVSEGGGKSPKNAILGWFVVGALILPLTNMTEANPLPGVVAIVFAIGLTVSRVRRKRFSPGWLLALVIAGSLSVISGIGQNAIEAQQVATDGYSTRDGGALLAFILPTVLALIARIRSNRA